MLRSILVALDSTPASAAAQRLAVDLAKRHDCDLTGFAVLDRAHITPPMAVGIGGMAYKEHLDKVKLEEARTFIAELEKSFRQICEAAGIRWQMLASEGIPHRLVEQESDRHDLLVIGKDTDFHFDFDPEPAATVLRLLRDNSRPVLVCPPEVATDGPVLAAYDGSVRSSRALHMLALLGHIKDRPVHVLSIADTEEEAERRAGLLTELFAKHGYNATPHGVATEADPAEIILAEVNALGATLVGMGTSGHSRLHDFFLGSATQRLLEACPCPMFVYH